MTTPPSNVVAKFYVSDVDPPEGATAAKITLSAVCRGIENAMWAQATPCGSIVMYVKNDPATAAFEKGAEYEVLFRRVEKPAPGDGHQPEPVANMHGWLVCRVCGQNLCLTPEEAAKAGSHQGYAEGSDHHKQALATHAEVYGA